MSTAVDPAYCGSSGLPEILSFDQDKYSFEVLNVQTLGYVNTLARVSSSEWKIGNTAEVVDLEKKHYKSFCHFLF